MESSKRKRQSLIQSFCSRQPRLTDIPQCSSTDKADATSERSEGPPSAPVTSISMDETTDSTDTLASPEPLMVRSNDASVVQMQALLHELFPGKRYHHHDICDVGCSFSKEEISRQKVANKDKKKEKRFNHSWLCKTNVAYDSTSGCWWPVFVEGEGVYCILCRKHNAYSTQNKQEVFSSQPSVRFKSATLSDHLDSRTHGEVVVIEQTQRGSVFEREMSNRKLTEMKTVECAMRNLYFLMKEEISNRKAAHLDELLEIQGVQEMKYFRHRSHRVHREMMLALGDAVAKSFLATAQAARCFGLLLDDLTDISVQEQMICFIQYLDQKTTKHIKFLFTTNLLSGESSSANAPTIKAALLQGLQEKNLDPNKFASMCTDGANVMTGEKNGLAAFLHREYPKLLTFHCVCHRLALATVDSSNESDMKAIDDVHNYLRQVWQLFENSPKKMATFLKIQANVNEVNLSQKGEKTMTTKLQKACKTRWLSFEASVRSVKKCVYPLLLALKQLEKDSAVTGGLYKKMYSGYFLGILYMLSEVLPILSTLSKTFQKGQLSFSHIKGSITYAKHLLSELLQEPKKDDFITQLDFDLKEGNLSATTIKLTDTYKRRLVNLKVKYVRSLTQNIDNRFSKCQSIFSAFKVFQPGRIPSTDDQNFKKYGEADVLLMAKHFAENVVDEDRLMAEWNRFKFDLVDLEGDIDVCLRLLCQSQRMYPLLSQVAEICYSAPVTNAWPERGVSAVKRIKTRLRSLLKEDMLNVLLNVSINGPPLADANAIIEDATKTWLTDKTRYKLRRVSQRPREETKEADHIVVSVTSAGTQTETEDDDDVEMRMEDLIEAKEREKQNEDVVAASLDLGNVSSDDYDAEKSSLESMSEDEDT